MAQRKWERGLWITYARRDICQTTRMAVGIQWIAVR